MACRRDLINVEDYGFIAEPRYYFYGWSKSPIIIARKSALEALSQARELLPKRYNFKIWDCYRTYTTQRLMHQSFVRRFKIVYPETPLKEIEKRASVFSGGVIKKLTHLNTHRHGGAFDLTVVDNKQEELYMGTDHDDLTDLAALDYFEKSGRYFGDFGANAKSHFNLEAIAQYNRKLLKRVMLESGFKPYWAEWWHWSYEK